MFENNFKAEMKRVNYGINSMDINCGACRNSIKVYCKKTMVR